MNSIVKIYKDCKILEEKNFIVDDIEDYLLTLSDTITLSGYQYQKHSLNHEIKIDKEQTYLDFKNTNDFNYVSIQNQQEDGTGKEKIVYYFVTSMNWLSTRTIRFNLVMDVLNTFKKGTDFTLSDKSTIYREHKDRWKEISSGTVTKTFTKWTYCLEYEDSTYNGEVLIKTGGSNLVVNSLTSNAVTTSYTISGGTIIVSLTNDNPFERITIVANVTYDGVATYQRIIDPISEGMQSILFKKKDANIYDAIDMRWYLVYKNRTAINPDEFNPQNPIDLYLYTDRPISYKKYNDATILVGALNNGDYWEINPNTHPIDDYGSVTLKYHDTGDDRDEEIAIYTETDGTQQGAIVYKYGGALYIRRIFAKYISGAWSYYYGVARTPDVNGVLIEHQGISYWYSGTFVGDPSDEDTMMSIPYATTYNDSMTPTSTTGGINSDIKLLDRTDSTIIKIIMSPYCPFNFPIESGHYVIPNGWEVASDMLKSSNVGMNFVNVLETDIDSPLSELYLKNLTINTNASRNDDNESKLLHSDFYQNQIVYDSFVYNIPLENIDETNPSLLKQEPDNFEIEWHTTNTIQSRFMMKFPQLKYKRSSQVFDNILYINRNNELSLFNSAFINYIRTGYNYDVKDKQRAIAQADDNLMFQAVETGGRIAGSAVNAMSGGSADGLVSTVAGGTVGILKTINNNAYLAMQLDSNIQRSLTMTKSVAISVSPADDVNLLLKYCPVAKSVNFKAGDNFLQAMADMFYYCGYTRNLQGNPDFNTRYWFNFVCANFIFDTTVNIPDECLADIIAKFNEGVTILHHHTTWNFDQDKENWEVSLL